MTQIPFAEVRDWMFKAALPLWARVGVDEQYGGFLEELDFKGQPTSVDFKRVRVTCRQVYVFSHAALQGWSEGAALSQRGYDYLLQKARRDDGGFVRLLTRQGAVKDATPDLYDISFALFAFAWRYRLTGDEEVRRVALETLSFVREHMRGPGAGFWQWLPPTGPRLQNPHMHLTEACIAAFEAFGEEIYLDQARELVALFRSKLFDGRTLGERFNDHWVRISGEEGRRLEPGHAFEWAWILSRYQTLTGEEVADIVTSLVAFGERFGINPKTGAVCDEVRDDGAPLITSSRSWPNTERIKAHLALFELTRDEPDETVAVTTRLLFDKYLSTDVRGLWMDHLDGDGKPIAKAVPASIFYHLFLAFSEILRLEPDLTAS
jgi:mannose/cellobiose epimerase-like protein (N-acyl-D-glucosamine 2-epimerase family)